MVFRGSGFRIKARRRREKPPWRACRRLADRGAGALAEWTGARSIANWLSDDRRIPSHGRNDHAHCQRESYWLARSLVITSESEWYL